MPNNIEATRKYIRDFDRIASHTKTALDLYNEMLAIYPERIKRAHGVFLVTNFPEHGAEELKQATAAVRAAKDAGVKHFVWSTLPDGQGPAGSPPAPWQAGRSAPHRAGPCVAQLRR
jgi:NmrA-like family